jgi:hypothetical protein
MELSCLVLLLLSSCLLAAFVGIVGGSSMHIFSQSSFWSLQLFSYLDVVDKILAHDSWPWCFIWMVKTTRRRVTDQSQTDQCSHSPISGFTTTRSRCHHLTFKTVGKKFKDRLLYAVYKTKQIISKPATETENELRR